MSQSEYDSYCSAVMQAGYPLENNLTMAQRLKDGSGLEGVAYMFPTTGETRPTGGEICRALIGGFNRVPAPSLEFNSLARNSVSEGPASTIKPKNT